MVASADSKPYVAKLSPVSDGSIAHTITARSLMLATCAILHAANHHFAVIGQIEMHQLRFRFSDIIDMCENAYIEH
jgi:hypothetical protein